MLSVVAFLLSRSLLAHRNRQERGEQQAPRTPSRSTLGSPRTPLTMAPASAPTPRKPHASLKDMDALYHAFAEDVGALDVARTELEKVGRGNASLPRRSPLSRYRAQSMSLRWCYMPGLGWDLRKSVLQAFEPDEGACRLSGDR
jgi:hypothetical protein